MVQYRVMIDYIVLMVGSCCTYYHNAPSESCIMMGTLKIDILVLLWHTEL